MSHPPAAAAPTGGRRDAVERLWGFFVSLELTLWLLVLLAAAAGLGAFFGPVPLEALRERLGGGLLYGLARLLELHDVFHSAWFALLLWALALNLVACTLSRMPRLLRRALRPDRYLTEQAEHDKRHLARVPLRGAIGEEAARVAGALREKGFLAELARAPDGTAYLFAERGLPTRFGAHLTHLALLVILLGAILGRLGGAEGRAEVSGAGGSFTAVTLQAPDGSLFPRPLGFAVEVADFRLRPGADGRPARPESELVIWRDGEQRARQGIWLNHPMEWGGWSFYQAGHRPSPDQHLVRIAVTDRLTGERREHRLLAEQAITLDDGVRLAALELDPDRLGSGPALRLGRAEAGYVTDFWVFQQRPGFDARNREDRWSVDFLGPEPVELTVIRAVRDPGVDVVFLGCALLVLGMALAFYSAHWRLWARVDAQGIALAGFSHRSPAAFARTFVELEAALRTGGPAPRGATSPR